MISYKPKFNHFFSFSFFKAIITKLFLRHRKQIIVFDLYPVNIRKNIKGYQN